MTGLEDIGIGKADFEDNALKDFGQSVTHVPRTETEDFRGNKTFVYTGTATITAVFHKRSITYVRDEKGVRMFAPAYLMSKTADNVSEGDKIIVSSGTGSEWKVHEKIQRADSTGIFNFHDLYLWE